MDFKEEIKKLSFSISYQEREFLVSRIRIGKIVGKDFDIYPPLLEDIISSYQIYEDTYNECSRLGIMNEDETSDFLKINNLWTDKEEKETEDLKEQIEDLKIEMFDNFFRTKHVYSLHKKVDRLNFLLQSALTNKVNLFSNSCETLAESEQKKWILQKSTIIKNDRVDLEDNFYNILSLYNSSILSEQQIRFLSRSEPWRSFWSISNSQNIPCIKVYEDSELTQNQKNLIMWSKSYDNIQESMECPPDKIIENDHALDGWIIKQNRKRDRDRKLGEIEQKLGKNNKGQEVMIMVDPEDIDSIKAIQSLNSPEAMNVIREREKFLQSKPKGEMVSFFDLPDQQEKIKQQSYKKQMDFYKRR